MVDTSIAYLYKNALKKLQDIADFSPASRLQTFLNPDIQTFDPVDQFLCLQFLSKERVSIKQNSSNWL